MPNHRRKLLPLCIAASLLSGLSAETVAIGVGDIHLQSFLGSPLQAEVPLSHLGDLGVDQLKVQLAAQDDYSTMGVEYTYLHSQLKIEPIVKNGQGYVRITSTEPITEPYLNFVLSLRWPQGQLVREFTVLLDPPTQAAAVASAAAGPAERSAEAVPAEIADAAQADAAPRRPHRRAAATNAAESAAAVPREGSYTIQRGDSLWRIANRMRAGVPVEQVMTAIHTLNPNAFINDNPNLLKEAATIALPSAEQIAAVAGSTDAIAQSAPAAAPAGAAVARDLADAAPAASAKPTIAASAGAAAAPVVDQLVEENSALKAEVAELNGNVATLNQNLVQSEQRLHQLESQLAELIQQMQQQRATIAALNGNGDTTSAPLVQGTGSVINQVNAADLAGTSQAHTPWWVHLLYWLGIGGAVTWAIREHFWPQRRLAAATVGGGADLSAYAEPVATAPMTRSSMRAPKIETVKDAADLTLDFEEPASSIANTAAIDNEPAPQLLKSNEEPVDASISAGVFVAFGRFSEAERLLRDAIAHEPARMDLKLQLLDVLMQSDQPGAFDDLAAEIEHEARTPEVLAELAVLRDSYRPQR